MVAASALLVPAAAWADSPAAPPTGMQPTAAQPTAAPAAQPTAAPTAVQPTGMQPTAPTGMQPTAAAKPVEAAGEAKSGEAKSGEGKEEAKGKEGEGKEGEGEKEGEERRWVFGAAFAALGPVGRKEATAAIGGGVFGEYTIIPSWLQAEASVRFLAEGSEKLVMPVDLLLKKPFELDHGAEAFIAAGGTIVPVLSGEGETAGGLATAVGSYFWLNQHAGLAFELNYNLIAEAELVHELGGALGVVYGL